MKSNNNKIYTIISIFALVSLFLVVFFVWPLSKKIIIDSQNLITDKRKMVSLEAQAVETENFKKNYTSYKPNLDKIEQMFVDPNDPVNFIEFLENASLASQIVSQVSLPPYSQNDQSPDQNFITFTLTSKGSFPNMLIFLKKIEAGSYLVEIENLTIQNSKDDNVLKNYSSREVDATFTIKTFVKQ